MQIHERSGGDNRSVACEDCGEAAYLRIRRLGGKAKWVPLNTDIVTCPYDHFLSMLERPLTMPMYQRSLAKMKTVYDSLDMIGPMPIHDWYNGTLRKWLRLHGDAIEWDNGNKMYIFLIVLADYMAAAHNVRGARGCKSYLSFVMQVLNFDDGVRQKIEWACPIQTNAMGKKPKSITKRMQWQLRIANEFLTGRELTYTCPHEGTHKTVHVYINFMFLQADAPMLCEVAKLAGPMNRCWFPGAKLRCYMVGGYRPICPLSINLDMELLTPEQVESTAAVVQRGEATMQETGHHGQWVFTSGCRNTPVIPHMLVLDCSMTDNYHILKGVVLNVIECVKSRLVKNKTALRVLNKRIHAEVVARGEEPHAHWVEYGFSKIMSIFDWFVYDMQWQLDGLLPEEDYQMLVCLWHFVTNMLQDPFLVDQQKVAEV
jgi:hypothetical protein